MKKAADFAPSVKFIKPVCLLFSAISLAFASRGLWSGYSYWLDELYSVFASLDTWHGLYQNWILVDVHPPLYQLVLKLWMLLFGSSEGSTRTLSFAFSFVTLSAFSFDAVAGKRWRRVTALLLIGASPAFAYYAQETRSYSLVLALSSVVTLSALQLRLQSRSMNSLANIITCFIYYVGAFLLSIAHYFGWIYVFVISVIGFFSEKIAFARSRSLLLVAAISVWPIWHVAFGDLGEKSGGAFWIKVAPPVLGTLHVFLDGCLPFMMLRWPSYLLFSVWGLIAALLLMYVYKRNVIKRFFVHGLSDLGGIVDETRFTVLATLLMVGILSLVDLHTPMSTPRNYIVLLPPVMIALANVLTMLTSLRGVKSFLGIAFSLIFILVFFVLAGQSWNGLTAKIRAHQNWKGLAEYVSNTKLCADGCFAVGSNGRHEFYFSEAGSIVDLSSQHSPLGLPAGKATLNNQAAYVKSRMDAKILGFHGARGQISARMEQSDERVCLQPPQTWRNSTFVILPKSRLVGSEGQFGLKECS